jgi:hypothetical protein
LLAIKVAGPNHVNECIEIVNEARLV